MMAKKGKKRQAKRPKTWPKQPYSKSNAGLFNDSGSPANRHIRALSVLDNARALRMARRAAEVTSLDRTELGPEHYVSVVRTYEPWTLMDERPTHRYEVAVFRPGMEISIVHFPTRQAAMNYYRRMVAVEQGTITHDESMAKQADSIRARQKKLRERMTGRLNFSKRKIRIRRGV